MSGEKKKIKKKRKTKYLNRNLFPSTKTEEIFWVLLERIIKSQEAHHVLILLTLLFHWSNSSMVWTQEALLSTCVSPVTTRLFIALYTVKHLRRLSINTDLSNKWKHTNHWKSVDLREGEVGSNALLSSHFLDLFEADNCIHLIMLFNLDFFCAISTGFWFLWRVRTYYFLFLVSFSNTF